MKLKNWETKKILNTACILMLSISLFAQESGNVNRAQESMGNNSISNKSKRQTQNVLPLAQLKGGRTVELEVDVLSNQKASAYVAIFNLTQMAATAEETNRLLTDRYNGFVEELSSAGISKADIYLDMISFVPIYEYEKEKKIFSKTHNEVPKGFEMQQNVHIKYIDAKLMIKIITIAAKYEIFDLVKVDYSIDNQEAVFIEMREKAVAHLVKEVELYVDKLGVDLETGYRIVAEEKKVSFPTDRYSSYSAFSNVSLGGVPEKGKVLDMYKPQTMYYDKVAYDNFDIVINPTVIEPAIQFMYNIKIQIILKDTTQPAKEYFWLTPDGDVVPVKVK